MDLGGGLDEATQDAIVERGPHVDLPFAAPPTPDPLLLLLLLLLRFVEHAGVTNAVGTGQTRNRQTVALPANERQIRVKKGSWQMRQVGRCSLGTATAAATAAVPVVVAVAAIAAAGTSLPLMAAPQVIGAGSKARKAASNRELSLSFCCCSCSYFVSLVRCANSASSALVYPIFIVILGH